MIFPKLSLTLLFWIGATRAQECVTPSALNCRMTTTPPTLDGDLKEWSDIVGQGFPITSALGVVPYPHGNMEIKCLYDDEQIYFAMEVPGAYRFDTEDNHKCASVSFMSKVGVDATYYDMGGCPQASRGCPSSQGVCGSYTVDLGGHWELRTTEQHVKYGINVEDGSGNDLIANKDDEYSVSAHCRLDDDGNNAGNEWAAAWSHTTTTTTTATARASGSAGVGSYIFEFSRHLQTDSPETDAQYVKNNTYPFGAAFWDPYEREDEGWTDSGHFITGCSAEWFDLVLDDYSPAVSLPSHVPTTASDDQNGSGAYSGTRTAMIIVWAGFFSPFIHALL